MCNVAQQALSIYLHDPRHPLIEPHHPVLDGVAEAVGQSRVAVELGVDAHRRECLQATLHGAPRSDTAGHTHASVGGGIGSRHTAIASVLHNNRRGLWDVTATRELTQVVAIAEYCRHPCSGTASPKRVAVRMYAKLTGMVVDECQGSGQIIIGRVGSVDDGESV